MGLMPELSVVIPVHNEERILEDSVTALLDKLPVIANSFEIVLCENGSRDRTLEAVSRIEARNPAVMHLRLGQPNYGQALRAGIQRARGQFVVCDEIDLCDASFYTVALKLLRAGEAEMVIGSKMAVGSRDERPWIRHAATWALNGMLRFCLGFRGTDTHGLKAFRRQNFLAVVESCVMDHDLFASEFVIRSQRAGRSIVEVPVRIRERRPPTINFFYRVPRALINLIRLIWVVRIQERLLQNKQS